ncbi:MAG: lactate racemase domain-containing protein [Phycisphaerae bacterium]
MPDVAVPWGRQDLAITLPDNWTVQQVVKPELRPAPADWPDRMAEALGQPAVGLPLGKLLAARPGGKVAVIVEDMTRHSPLSEILPILLRELDHARVDRANLEVVFATGMHPPLTAAQARAKLGPLASELRWRCNPWHDRKAYIRVGNVGKVSVLVDRGVAGADLRIIVSSVSPHLQAGFGGGYKMLVPGCAPRETIRVLHRQGLGRGASQLVGSDAEANAMRQAIDAAGALIDQAHGRTFAVQYLLDGDDRPSAVAAGDVVPTQRMLAKQCAAACGVATPAPADVLVTNAFPRDFDLWQSFKGIANTLWAARPNGVVVCLARCEAGVNGMARPPRWPFNQRWTRRILRAVGPETLGAIVMRLVPRLAGDAAFFIRMAAQMLNRNPIILASPTLHAAGVKFPGLVILPTAGDAIAAASALLGNGPQRATVFPYGGITFPVPTA